MSSEHGLYVELLPDGKIKRDIVGSSGEASLEDTVVSGEVILFSELNFEPYAVVVDLIRSQARAILMHDSHGGLANMTLFQFMLDTVEDLVSTWNRKILCTEPCSAHSWKTKSHRMTEPPCTLFGPARGSSPF